MIWFRKGSVNEIVITVNRPQYQKLKDQNRKLKEELKELAKAADEALQRERQNKTAKRNKEEDPELKGE